MTESPPASLKKTIGDIKSLFADDTIRRDRELGELVAKGFEDIDRRLRALENGVRPGASSYTTVSTGGAKPSARNAIRDSWPA
jgi:hypothetical protein